jgi:lipopolysaccharide transport system ATP-binding protein
MKPIIRAENISKQYRIGTREAAYGNLRDALAGAIRAPFKRLLNGKERTKSEMVWALKDVSFEIAPGETVGLIGRNGAGKSTLLKILSRITEPTTGRAELYGRIGSLLEVGTGFHPELTGRENLYLNGAILGMGRTEIERKFDEIVAFSEIEKFIDTPIKWYSSGMHVRLAFSVAAHLEPEILILDEVLAVGDAAFQIKCMTKMQEIRNEGRTILFVSHSMQTVTRLCKRAIYLVDGMIAGDGPSHQVVSTYLSSRLKMTAERTWEDLAAAPGGSVARLRAVRVRTEEGEVTDVVDIRRPVGVEMEFEVLQAGHVLGPTLHFFNEEGIYLFFTRDQDTEWRNRPRPAGRFKSTVWIPGNFFAEGTILVSAGLDTPYPAAVHFYERDAIAFEVADSTEGGSVRGDYIGPIPGVIRPLFKWTTNFNAPSKAILTSSVKGGSL